MRVVVADDHALVRDGISSLLEAAGFEVVAQVSDGLEALAAASSLQPDTVLMDISMPGMDGLQALREIKAQHPQIKVVILTVSDDDQDLLEALRYGAQGYLLKSMDSASFVRRMEQLDEGDMAVDPNVVNKIVGGYVELAQGDPPASKEILTPREIELLGLVAEGLPNKAIAQRLSVSENTVKYHVRQILNKLGVQNRTEAVTSAIRLGLINTE